MTRRDPRVSLIAALGLAAVSIGLFACYQQYRDIRVVAGAEDDCNLFHGIYALADVEPGITDTQRPVCDVRL